MSARSGSLAYVVIAGALAIGLAGMIWGIFDSEFIATITGTGSWSSTDQYVSLGREYVLKSWDFILLIVLVRIGLDALVASRLRGSSSAILMGTISLFFGHLLIVMWALVFPEIAHEFYDIADTTSQVQASGFMTAVDLGFEWGIAYAPALLLVGLDVWYISAPIRNDLLRRPA